MSKKPYSEDPGLGNLADLGDELPNTLEPPKDRMAMIKERSDRLKRLAAAGSATLPMQELRISPALVGDLVVGFAVHALIMRSGPSLDVEAIGRTAVAIDAAAKVAASGEAPVTRKKRKWTRRTPTKAKTKK